MFCLFGSSECANLFDVCDDEEVTDTMHSSETPPAQVAPATGPGLLLQLGRLIIRSRSSSPAPRTPPAPRDRLLHAKLRPATRQVQTQPKAESEESKPGLEAQLSSHVHQLWNDQIPVCIEVLLAPDCAECYASISRPEGESFDRHQPRALLLERWTMQPLQTKPQDGLAFITSQWLLNAVRSQLHFSQLSAWLATLKHEDNPTQRRRKLSRETCNFKKIEANCDASDLSAAPRSLNIVYSIRTPASPHPATFPRTPTNHHFPITDIGNNVYLKVVLESLPRIDEIPTLKCTCQKRRTSKEIPVNIHEEITGKLNDLSLGSKKYSDSNHGNSSRRLSIVSIDYDADKDKKVVDDRMHTPCSENGKHRCNCDDESDGNNHRSSTSLSQEPKKLDERRLKEIAKYKRRLRKESKLKKLCDSTSSEDGQHKTTTHTSIPILQAARFDRFRAIGCYRNQTYLTLPASRIEGKSPFMETVSIPPTEFKKTSTVATQTDDLACHCGNVIQIKCDTCHRNRLVRSEGNYDLASLDHSDDKYGARRKCEDEGKVLKKHKCDNISNNTCDNLVFNSSVNDQDVVKRPKLRRFYPLVDRIEKIVSDRCQNDMEELELKNDDSVFSSLKQEPKRQKTFSINEEYVCYEKCDYGTIDKCELESPKEGEHSNNSDKINKEGFIFPEGKKGTDNQVPSPSEMDKFRWRFDSAASMVFHTKTGLPLTSSPAPLRRGNNCFDFDDSINGISGIKSALFHPISPPSPAPASPASPTPSPRLPPSPVALPRSPQPAVSPSGGLRGRKEETPKLRMGPSTGLLGSFEESALKGRLEPVATVHGFTAELGASGAFCPPHRRLPVTVFFYAPGGTNAPYMGHINLGPSGYRVARSGTIQVSLFNPHGTLVKMFVVLYELTCMPPMARTFLRQRTLYMPAGAEPPTAGHNKWLRYLIHLRFMTSKSGKLYLHTDIRIIVSRKADLDTATAHSLYRPMQSTSDSDKDDQNRDKSNRSPNRVFGGSSEFDSELKKDMKEIGYDNQNGVSYELRSFTYAPENPKYSPR